MNRKIDKALANLAAQAEKMASYDDDNYEDGMSYDEESASFSNQNNRGIVRQGKRPLVVVRSHQNPGRKLDKAQFDINITRLTNTIAAPLPVAVFGTTHSRSGYKQFLIPPTGATLAVVGGLNSPVAGTTDRLRFTYTSGLNIDSIDVTCNQVPYPVFLDALGADVFRISNIRYRLTNSADTIQFSQQHQFESKSLFGKQISDDITIGAYLKPEQFQPGVIDIPIAADVDKETMFIANISDLATAYPFNLTLSVFVEKFNKHDRMGMK